MRKKPVVGIILAISLCLAGCSDTAIQRDTLSVSGDGSAVYTIVSDFSDPAYDLGELMAMAEEEVRDYGTGVRITESIVEEGVLHFQYEFDSLSNYAGFMQTSCFHGTVSQALKQGFKSDTKLKSAKDGSTIIIGADSLETQKLFVWNEAITVRCDGRVLYYSPNLSLSGKTDVIPADGSGGPYYVIYK